MDSNDQHSGDAPDNQNEPNGVVSSPQRQQGQPGGQTSGSATTMMPGLQEQITQALQPLMGNLRQQVSQAIKQQNSTSGGTQSTSDSGANQSKTQGAMGNLQESLQNVFAQVRTAIQQAVDWIVKMARTVFATVRSWLQKLSAAISKLAVSLAMSGAKSAARPILKAAVNKGVDALEQRSKQTLGSVTGGGKPTKDRASAAA